jgi:hypothetical protein
MLFWFSLNMFRNIDIYVDLLKYKHVEINKLSDINPVTL